MIELRKLTKSYPTRQGRKFVFRDIDAVFPAGKNIGIFGPNGAGKSTLLRLLGGTDFPDSGKIITKKKVSFPVGLRGGFQGSLTGRDNVKFVCRIHNIKGTQMQDVISYVMDFAEIGKYFDMPVRTYSSGMRARLGFALSMAVDFDYYLIDEVTAVGDYKFKEKSKAVFNEKSKTANLIIVSHDISKIRQHCEIGVFMKNGEVLVCEDINDAIRLYRKS
jgi:capsular polysaccharide transport system ATP-binding protein